MYLPEHFRVSDQDEIFALLDANAFGQLVSVEDGRPSVSHLPFLLSTDRRYLHCHLARQNSQWRQLEGQQVLATFQGAHDYISPSWYRNEKGRSAQNWPFTLLEYWQQTREADPRDFVFS